MRLHQAFEIKKRKPRDKWLINKNTHTALITEAEAKILVHNLENSSRAESVSNARRGISNYLLTGVLVSPDGRKWESQQEKAYRLKKNNQLKGRQLQSACVDKAVIDQLLTDLKSDKFVDQLFDDLNKLEQEINRLDQEYVTQITLQTITKHQIKNLINNLADELHEKDKSKLKNLINSMIDRIMLDPLTLECRIHYKIAVDDSLVMASPGGFEPPLPP